MSKLEQLNHEEAFEEVQELKGVLDKVYPEQKGDFSKEQYQKETEKIWAQKARIQDIIDKAKEELEKMFQETEIRAGQVKQEIKVKEENKQKLLEILEESGFDPSSNEDIGGLGDAIAGGINELFGKHYNLSVSGESLPVVVIKNDQAVSSFVHFRDEKNKKSLVSSIQVNGLDDVLNGNYFCEEMAHFYRYYFEPDQLDDEEVGEFFGFLGKKMWQKVASSIDGDLKLLVDYEEQSVDSEIRNQLYVRSIEKQIELLQKQVDKEAETDKLRERLRNYLIHDEGYKYADKLDLDKITDWKKLFSLPNEEVRRRFFTSESDYYRL